MYPPLYSPSALAVDPDGGCGHHAFEIDEDALASRFRRQLEAATVERDELVGLLVKAVPWEAGRSCAGSRLVEAGVVEIFRVAAFDYRAAVTPLSIHGEDEASGGG